MAGLTQDLPSVAVSYDVAQRAETTRAVSAALRQWRRIRGDVDTEFLRIAPNLIEIANLAQTRVADRAAAYVPDVLAATDQGKSDVPAFEIDTRQWVGTDGAGLPTESLMYGAVTHTKDAISSGFLYADALAAGGKFLTSALGTALSDTARGAEGAATYSRPVGGYIRMLTPPSCGRCIVLAGKWYRNNKGFQRHPGCDCRHIPTAESIGTDMTVNSQAYLDGLDDDALAKALGSQANAEAFKEFGADSSQLVNAYRKSGGIRTAQVYGKDVKYTLEGTTRRGVAYLQMSRVRALSAQGQVKDGRYRRLVAPRLMPASIFQIATSKDHAERLLRDHGWLGITN